MMSVNHLISAPNSKQAKLRRPLVNVMMTISNKERRSMPTVSKNRTRVMMTTVLMSRAIKRVQSSASTGRLLMARRMKTAKSSKPTREFGLRATSSSSAFLTCRQSRASRKKCRGCRAPIPSLGCHSSALSSGRSEGGAGQVK